MTPDQRWRLRGAPIIHDTIDNETIAINQLTGAYYSLQGPSALAWEMLGDGASAAGLAGALVARYRASLEELQAAAVDFLAQLQAEEMIVPAPGGGTDDDAQVAALPNPATDAPDPIAARPPFPGLAIQRYTDLETILLADPIHEVDESGWPKPMSPGG